MKNYIQTLGTLLNLPHHVIIARAASSLVAKEWIKINPIPCVADCDAEMRELLAEV